MSLRSWFRGSSDSPASTPKSSTSSGSTTPQPNGTSLTPAEQKIADIQDAMVATGLIMNDDIEGAEARLLQRKDPTAFHKLGLGVTAFMRSILGFEKEVMAEAVNRLYECETKAWAEKEKAERKGQADPGQLFPPGSEYALVYAESLLMSAMVSVLHESLTDALKGFYKLRKAFLALNKIVAAQDQILRDRGLPTSETHGVPDIFDDVEPDLKDPSPGDEEDFEFIDALEKLSEAQSPASPSSGLAANGKSGSGSASSAITPALDKRLADLKLTLPSADASTSDIAASLRSQTASPQPPGTPAGRVFTHPVDMFIHSGTNMCFGILLLMISMVPPAFSRLLSIIGFRGDRGRGVSMLWQSTAYPNVNGAVAGMMLLGYYNGLLASADVLPTDQDIAEHSESGEIAGYPRQRCMALLRTMRERYPDSGMWKLEEARMLAQTRRLSEAVEVLNTNGDSKMRQVAALNTFELALNHMYLMDWPNTKTNFMRMVELNDWSHALYYYIAGCAELEMYRDAMSALAAVEKTEGQGDGGDNSEVDEKKQTPEQAELEASARQHKKAAEELFRKAPAVAGRKRFMARQMPFEELVQRKVAKWEARATALGGIDLADAIGPSPAQEMIYLWNGARRMTPEHAQETVKGLEWERCTAPAEKLDLMKNETDEASIRSLCRAVLLRVAGETEEARSLLADITKQDRSEFKGGHKDDYVLPTAHYELGVLAWDEAAEPERWPKDASEVDTFRQQKTDECASFLETIANWEAYVLDARFGMKVRTGLDSVRWLRTKKGWAATA